MEIRKQLGKLGVKPVEGQNFLNSEPVIQALVESGEIEEGQKVLEIGGGTGSITEKLAEKDADITVLEKNTVLSDHLEEEFPNIEVLNEDVLEFDLDGFDRCASNIPFQLSKKILGKLGEAQVQSSLILQDELADKIVAEPGSNKYSEYTVRMNYYFIPVKLRTVPKTSFHPQPNVDAAIIKLYPNKERHGIEDEEKFFEMVKALFTHKRKKVRNAFVDARHMIGMDKDDAKKVRDDLPHSEKRVNELEVIELKEISEFLD